MDVTNLRLAMIACTPGNGHPFGYNRQVMTQECPFPGISSAEMYGGFGCLQLCGTAGHVQVAFADTFYAFKAQLTAFVDYVRTGKPPFPFTETVELMQLVIARRLSREHGGREVPLDEILLN